MVFSGVFAIWPNYLVNTHGYAAGDVSQLWSLAASLELPFMVLSGWISDKHGRLLMLGLSLFAWTMVYTGYVVLPVIPWILMFQIIRGFAFGAFTSTSMTYATELKDRSERASVTGLYSSANGAGAILGSITGGTLAQIAGPRTVISSGAVIVFATAVFLITTRKRNRSHP